MTFEKWFDQILACSLEEKSYSDMRWDLNDQKQCEFIFKFFSDVENYLKEFSNEDAAKILEFLINPSLSDICYVFLNSNVQLETKRLTIGSIFSVFKDIFNNRCEKKESRNLPVIISPLNNLCYMWWDIFPRHGVPKSPQYTEVDKIILSLLSKLLELNNIACKESALHGLGHWYSGYPEKIISIIESSNDCISENLRTYASQASKGNIG